MPSFKLLVYPVTDIAQTKALFTQLLGIEPYADAPYYVGFRVGELEIGLNPNGHKEGMTGPIGYWHVDDIKQSLQTLRDTGAQIKQDVTDVGYGRLIASVQDGDGNMIGLMQEP